MLSDRVIRELEEAEVKRGDPLVVVDADEVLVHFADDFAHFCAAREITFALREYRLDTAFTDKDGWPLARDRIDPLLHEFIDNHTHEQREIDGAREALASLAADAQVVVLTNAPVRVRDERIVNLKALGMDYPVIVNEGGKGRALNWLQSRADAPVAFVDDSPIQHESAAKHAEPVRRLHLIGSVLAQPVTPPAEHAHHHTNCWVEAEALIRRAIAAP